MEGIREIARCRGCFGLLVGPYFSCLRCLEKGPDTYDLCCYCYRQGNLSHEHSFNFMTDHHSLIKIFRDRTAAAEISRDKKDMDELHEIAKAYYRAGSPEVQARAYEFYQSMDTDRDGRVSLSEFLEFMRQEGYTQIYNPNIFNKLDRDGNGTPNIFNKLDRDGNGTLEFYEVMTLYYIIKSGRPVCKACHKLIPGVFFSCVKCFNNPQTSFNLCPDCFRSSKCIHDHDGRTQFLDNYMLLQIRRDPALAQALGVNPNEAWNTTSSNAIIPTQHSNIYIQNAYQTHNTYVGHPSNQALNHSNAVVPAGSNRQKWKAAFKAFEVALGIGGISSNLCTIM